MRKPEGFELAGHIGVDAGLCWIGDPCYILHAGDNFPKKDLGSNWVEFCNLLDFSNGSKSFGYDAGHEGLGVVTSTGYGDGFYPVYIKKNREGRVVEVRVLFD